MSRIDSRVFGPMMPKIDPELLPEKVAQLAQNLRLSSGALEPWKQPGTVAGVTLTGTAAIKTLYRFGRDTTSKTNYWFQFTNDVNVVKGPIASDTEERTYWTDGTYPKKTKSDLAGLIAGQGIAPASLRMGVPPPGWAGPTAARTYTPGTTLSGTATDTNSAAVNSVYVVTYVSTWDEESAPSNASSVVTWRSGQSVSITLPGNISGAYSINRVRIYRSSTGSNRSSYQLLTTLPVATATYVDSAPTATLGETCPSFDWLPPPDGLLGLVDMGNGVLAGFEKNTVYFCEPNYPYAWPVKYDSTVSAPIVGLAVFGQTLVVTTREGVTLITGTDPASMSQESPKGLQSCVSKRSMVEMMGGVVYAAPDGLFLVAPGVSKNLTEDIMSRADWQSYVPSSMHCYALDGRYYAFYDTGSVQGLLIFSFGADPGFVKCDQYATAAYVEDALDSMFMSKFVSTVNTLYEWDTGPAMTVKWRSKENRFLSGTAMARAMVLAASYPVTYRLYGDGALKHTQTVNSAIPFILPDGRNYTVSHEVESTSKVTSVRTASSMKELGDA